MIDIEDFSEIFKIGTVITQINGMVKNSSEIDFTLSNGDKYRMYHEQECCEVVELEDVVGNPDDLLNEPLTKFEEATTSGITKYDGIPGLGSDGNCTYTYYKFATKKGYVDLRWYGSSSGWYSERVNLKKI